MRQMERQQAAINRLVLDTSFATDFALADSIRQLNHLSLQAIDFQRISHMIHRSWLNDMIGAAIASDHLANIASITVSNASYDLAAKASLLPTIHSEILESHLAISASAVRALEHSMSALWARYDGLIQSFQSIDQIVRLPSFVLPGATREISATGYAINVVYPSSNRGDTEDIDDTEVIDLEFHPDVRKSSDESGLITLLEPIGPEFVRMYRGAVTALSDNNPDRSRHVLTSLRELWNHLIRRLAPQEEVLEWVADQHDRQNYLHNGRPTRRAKLGYILKSLGADPLRRFVEADTKAMLALYELYDRLHGLDTGLNDEQLIAITLKTESYLVFILRVREFSAE